MSKFLITILLAMSLSATWAESIQSLDVWVEEALKSHPEVAALEANIDAARAEKHQAALRPAQELSVGGGFKDTDEDSGYAVGAELMMTSERKGKRDVRTALAENNIIRAELALDAFRSELALNVKTLGVEYIIADKNAKHVQEIAARSQAMIDQLKQRPVAGPPLFLELKVIEASLIELQYSARSFSAERDSLQIQMNSLLGRSADKDLNLSASLTPPNLQFDRNSLLKKLETGPELQARLAEQARKSLGVTAATLDGKQDVSWGPFVEREDAGETETVIGLSFSIPLAGSKRNQGNVAAAKAQQLSADAGLKLARQETRGELIQQIRFYDLATEQLDNISTEMIDELRGAADLADRQYRLGAIPVQLFLEVQREYLNVLQLRNDAMLSAWKHALNIQWLTGTLTEELP